MVNILKHLQAILLLPGMVILVVPALILNATGTNLGWALPMPVNILPIVAGVCLIAFGLLLMFQTISLFVRVGKGTLAPWTPTQHLVVRGVYRYVRNPMISGVLCVLIGEASLAGSSALLVYAVFAALLNFVYIPTFEEPDLVARFGADYDLYRKNVPRWIPRLRPWDVPAELQGQSLKIWKDRPA